MDADRQSGAICGTGVARELSPSLSVARGPRARAIRECWSESLATRRSWLLFPRIVEQPRPDHGLRTTDHGATDHGLRRSLGYILPMKLRLLARLFIPLFVIALAAPGGMFAQGAAPAGQAAPAAALAEKLPFDAAVTRGTLPNGIDYYIRRNTRPEKRVALRLAVKAGSVDEENDQQGLAHFLEHMAFNGTRRFKPGELIAALESTGARLGPHVNAYTSFDETVYMFELPTDKTGLVEKGMQALADFAGGMSLDPIEIDKERGVVVEEWRGGLGAGSRIRDQQIPVLFYESKYAERLPIGKPEILKAFKPERLRAFYTKWYRPDRMAVVAVGDVEVATIEALIKKEFGALPKAAGAAPARSYTVPLQSELLVKVATDPEATQSSVSLINKRAHKSDDTVGGYRRDLIHRLAFQMLNERFDDLSRKPDAKFLDAGAYESGLSPTTATVGLGASVQEGKIAPGLSAVVIEARRAAQHGFGAGELDRAKKRIIASYERAYNERDKTESGGYVQEYVNHFLEGEPSPGIAHERTLVQALLPGITAADASAAAKQLFGGASRVILATSPQKQGLSIPTEAELRTAVAEAEKVTVTAWNEAAATAALMARDPTPAAFKDRREIEALGVTVVRYGNGVEAWFKPTDFKNDEVIFSLVSSGGVVAGAAGPVRRGLAVSGAGTAVGRRRPSRRRPSEADGRQDRLGQPVDVGLDPRDLWRRQSRQHRDRAAASLSEVHRPGQRRRRLRADQEEPRELLSEPRARSRGRVRREDRRDQYQRPLHRQAAHARPHRQARSRRDGRLLQGPLLECGGLHLLHGRRVQAGRGAAAGGQVRGVTAVEGDRRRHLQAAGSDVPREGGPREGREGARAAGADAGQLLRRAAARGERAVARRSRDRRARDRAARHPARRARRDLRRQRRPGAEPAAARRRPHRRQLRRRPRQDRLDGRAGDERGGAAAGRRDRPRTSPTAPRKPHGAPTRPRRSRTASGSDGCSRRSCSAATPT